MPLSRGWGAGSPSNTMWPGLRSTSLPSGVFIHPAVSPQIHNRHAPKTGGRAVRLLGGAATPSNTPSPRPRFTYVLSGFLIHQPFDHNRHGPKIGWGLCPFWRGNCVPIEHKVAWAEAYLHTKWHLSLSCHFATTDTGRILGTVPL